MNEYPNWNKGKTPDTHTKAKVTKTRNVIGVDVIEVTGGTYRSATLDGVFELTNSPAARLPGRVSIRCSWFGVTPPTRYPQLSISNATVTQRPNYTGPVADDISV